MSSRTPSTAPTTARRRSTSTSSRKARGNRRRRSSTEQAEEYAETEKGTRFIRGLFLREKLTDIPGLGTKTAEKLEQKANIHSVDELLQKRIHAGSSSVFQNFLQGLDVPEGVSVAVSNAMEQEKVKKRNRRILVGCVLTSLILCIVAAALIIGSLSASSWLLEKGVEKLNTRDCSKAEWWLDLARKNEDLRFRRGLAISNAYMTRSNVTWQLYRAQVCIGNNDLSLKTFSHPREVCPPSSPLEALINRTATTEDVTRIVQGAPSQLIERWKAYFGCRNEACTNERSSRILRDGIRSIEAFENKEQKKSRCPQFLRIVLLAGYHAAKTM
eukprot:gb/GECG01016799.1/.p1 GENE.gb/GECG01016799.1/~~gb/GECG01016799.1/.p1  ORF type:complete len:329 (+),score=45.99 gb/GECG01016799.1/:1-987(+)